MLPVLEVEMCELRVVIRRRAVQGFLPSGYRGVNDVSNLGMCHLIRAMCGVGDFVRPTVNVSLGNITFTLGWCKQLASLQSRTPWNGLCMMGFSWCHISTRGLANVFKEVARNLSHCTIIFTRGWKRNYVYRAQHQRQTTTMMFELSVNIDEGGSKTELHLKKTESYSS